MNRGPVIGVVPAAAAAVVLLAGVPVIRLLLWLLVLACPLMLLFLHRGHGGHASHGAEHTEPTTTCTPLSSSRHRRACSTCASEGGARQ